MIQVKPMIKIFRVCIIGINYFQFGVKSARSYINEFDSFVRLDLACILDEEDNCESAAEVKWTLDNLIAAYNARLDLESNYGKK